MQAVTLIIDKRTELSTKYKKILKSDFNEVIISKDLVTSLKIIQDKEPDLIIISDSFDDDLSDFCQQVRALTYNMRPIIVALSKSADYRDRIKVLQSGADDFLSEPVNSEEFKERMNAHLRREYESNLDILSKLPNKNYSLRAIKRYLTEQNLYSIMYIRIENFENYKQIYTSLASDKLLQTYQAIIKSAITDTDYLGTLEENVFLVITSPLKAELLAKFLTFAFDSVVDKFYAEHDLDRGYLILQGDDYDGQRINFVHTTISVISNEYANYNSPFQILTSLIHLNKLANKQNTSNYIVERAGITGADAIQEKIYNNNIVIFETDEALALLLNTILKLQGYNPTVIDVYNTELIQEIPALMIIDAGDLERQNGLNFCYKLKQMKEFNNTKLIVTSTIHDKELVLNAGADLYIPKPYEISNLIKWVNEYIKAFNI